MTNRVLLALACVLLVVRLPSLVQPMGADQGLYAYVGERIRSGGMPYRNGWDQKPPAIHVTYAAMRAILPRDAAVPAADARMAQYVQQYLDTIAARRNTTMTAKVRECIYTILPSSLCSPDKVGVRLGIDRRTVHRHLAREGQTFSSVMDSVRAELVTRYIENRDRPLASVSELLGFSALSAFSRWFKNQFGCNVTEWRAGRDDPLQAKAGSNAVADKGAHKDMPVPKS